VIGNHASRTQHALSGIRARHVRLRIATPSSTPDEGARIYEFEVRGPAPTGAASP
jgi:hypothetical protein